MAKVKGPLFSDAASGNFGAILQFACGHFCRKIPDIVDEPSVEQEDQRTLFAQGAPIWSTSLFFKSEHSFFLKQILTSFPKIFFLISFYIGVELSIATPHARGELV